MRALLRFASAIGLLSLLAAAGANAATVTLVVKDAAGTGFNDPTPVAAVPGNSGTTLGQQRLNAFQAAANVWAGKLQSNVVIQVGVQMSALTCTSTSGILGQAGPHSVNRDFSGAPRAATWYAAALANARHGADLDAPNADIDATFNSTLDEGTLGCLNGLMWWYGINAAPQGNTIDFFGTVLHEIAHGLGFLTFVSQSGVKFNGFDDSFMVNLEDHSLGLVWPNLSDSQRGASSIDSGDLHWIGTNVTSHSTGVLSAGLVGTHVRMFAPNPFQSGSSVSHWDTVLSPNELMEPIATPDGADRVTTFALQDSGWLLQSGGCTYTLSPTGASPGAAGGSGFSVGVTTTSGCAWTATSNSAFITITSGSSGSGSGTVTYSVSANSGSARSGTMTIAGQTFTVNQAAGSGGSGCVANATTLCVGNRFKVQVDWFTSQAGGLSGTATAVSAASLGFSAGGIFWFFDATNPEMLVKVLNGCATNNRYWVFETAGTNVGFIMTVTDTSNGTVRTYSNPDLTLASPIQDTLAFATCP